MSWRLVTLDATGRESKSSPVADRQAALDWATDLADGGTRVVRIIGPRGRRIDEAAILEWVRTRSPHRALA